MIKMTKKSIILSFVIIALAFSLFMAFVPDTASAEGGRNVHYGLTERELERARVKASASDGFDKGGTNTYSNYTFPAAPSGQPVLGNSVRNTSTRVETEPVEGQDEGAEFSDMAANALFGGSSFMPSGITQWILFIIFILILTLIVRRFFGMEQAYHTAPLKHD